MLLSGCGSPQADSVASCVSRFARSADGIPVPMNVRSVVYTYDVSALPDHAREKLMRSDRVVITGAIGNGRQAEQAFLREPVIDRPRMLLAARSLYRIRQPGRGSMDATVAFGCGLLGPEARLIVVDTTVAPLP